jgi:outer membrane protein OmpA-like peptidoglycan-associated protein
MKFILLILVCTSISIIGQSGKQKIADKMFNELNLFEAVQVYEEIASSDKKDYHNLKRTADCHRLMNNTIEAEKWYALTVDFGTENPIDYYYLANAMKSNGNLTEVDNNLKIYAGLIGAEYEWNYSEFIAENKENALNFSVTNLAFNSIYSDFGAVLKGNEILFVSNRVSIYNEGETVAWDNTVFNEIYTYTEVDSVELFFSSDLTKGIHDGPVAILNDKLYITRNLNAKTGRKVLKLNVLGETEGEWFAESNFAYNDENYSVGHAAFSKDGLKMVFASDMPGGSGETDIWYSNMVKGEWSQPVNFGSEINTFDKELFPYLADNGDLYFSSLGHKGMGGLDLFVSYWIDGEYKTPENLGYPINTRFDDFSFAYDNYNLAYFSSNREEGKGDDDIYKTGIIEPFKYNPPITDTINPITSLTLEVLTITCPDKFIDGVVSLKNESSGHVIEQKLVAGNNIIQLEEGSNYTIEFSKEGYFPSSSDLTVEKNEIAVNTNSISFENVYFDFNSSYLNQDSKGELNKLAEILISNTGLKISINAYTDFIGDKKFNLQISEKRAKRVFDYLKSKGVKGKQMTHNHFGDANPILECEDESKCTRDELKVNRRVEFKTI